MDLKEGSILVLKGLVATGGQDPEQGPWFTAVDLLVIQVHRKMSVSQGKQECNKNPNPNERNGG